VIERIVTSVLLLVATVLLSYVLAEVKSSDSGDDLDDY
jgi:hypothetical protein